MSEDATELLWAGRTRAGALSVRLLTKGRERLRPGSQSLIREALDGCDAVPSRGGDSEQPGDQRLDDGSWSAASFRILHPRDQYADVWGTADLSPAGEDEGHLHGNNGGSAVATVLVRDGSFEGRVSIVKSQKRG